MRDDFSHLRYVAFDHDHDAVITTLPSFAMFAAANI